MGPLSYMRSVVDRNVVMRRIPLKIRQAIFTARKILNVIWVMTPCGLVCFQRLEGMHNTC